MTKTRKIPDFPVIAKWLLVIRGSSVILDVDVAALYGIETKRVNEAVRNNPDKFPEDYMFMLNAEELERLRSKISTAKPFPKTALFPRPPPKKQSP